MEEKPWDLAILAGLALILVGGIVTIRSIKKRHDKLQVIDKLTTPYADWPWPTMPAGNDLIDYKDYREELYEEVTARYDGFGKELYSLMRQRMPDACQNLKFYMPRDSDDKTDRRYDDSLAVYERGDVTLLITLSYWNAICLSNGKTFVEIQDWGQDYYEEALMKIVDMAAK